MEVPSEGMEGSYYQYGYEEEGSLIKEYQPEPILSTIIHTITKWLSSNLYWQYIQKLIGHIYIPTFATSRIEQLASLHNSIPRAENEYI